MMCVKDRGSFYEVGSFKWVNISMVDRKCDLRPERQNSSGAGSWDSDCKNIVEDIIHINSGKCNI